jgi:hypothetical protein
MPIPDENDHCDGQLANRRKNRMPPPQVANGGDYWSFSDTHQMMPPPKVSNGGDDEEYRVIRLNKTKNDNRLDDARSRDGANN